MALGARFQESVHGKPKVQSDESIHNHDHKYGFPKDGCPHVVCFMVTKQ